jgi:hypothetical protein
MRRPCPVPRSAAGGGTKPQAARSRKVKGDPDLVPHLAGPATRAPGRHGPDRPAASTSTVARSINSGRNRITQRCARQGRNAPRKPRGVSPEILDGSRRGARSDYTATGGQKRLRHGQRSLSAPARNVGPALLCFHQIAPMRRPHARIGRPERGWWYSPGVRLGAGPAFSSTLVAEYGMSGPVRGVRNNTHSRRERRAFIPA